MKNLFRAFLALMLFMGLEACSGFVDDINVDPNNPSDAPLENVLNAVFTGIITPQTGEDARLGCMWAQQFSGVDRQYSAFNVYNMTAENFEWDKYYLAAKNADIVIDKANVTENKLARGIAKTLKALCMGTVTSHWGDCPFSEANRYPDIEEPKFDNQAAVYAGIQTLLDEALADFGANPTNPVIAGVDFYLGGSAAAWSKVAHSLKARYYTHTKEYSKALTEAKLGIDNQAGDWAVPFAGGNTLQDQNTYNAFGVDFRAGYMDASSAILPQLLDTVPGNAKYRGNAKTDESARYRALFVGETGAYDLNYDNYWAATASFPIINALETQLILAEAAARTGAPDEALSGLNAARALLSATFGGTYADYVLDDFNEGNMAGIPGKSRDEALLYEIVEEKYCSLAGQNEVFNDLRRTKNLLGFVAISGGTIPQRFLIPQVEVNSNSSTPQPLPKLFDVTPVNQ